MPVSTASSPGSTASADAGGPPAVQLLSVHKSFGKAHALRGVSLTVHPGEVVGLLGPNGAGKTTAISLMLGLRQPSSGSARVFGLDPRDLRARSCTGVMLQESGIPLTLRVREIIDLFRSYYPAPLAAADVARAAGVGDSADKLCRDLSGGQRQRVYFALAICGDPEILFLDEPTVGLDTATRRGFWDHVRSFKQRGRAIVLTTHYLDEADAVADRIVVIDSGVVVADDTPAAIRARVPSKKVTFRWPQARTEALAGLPVESLAIAGEQVSFLTSEPEAVLRALFAGGAQLTELEVAGAGLEEAVLVMTHGR